MSQSSAYQQSGVDIHAGYQAVKLMKPMVESTFTPGVLGGIGGFGGLFEPDMSGYERPVFISGTDGVGTKLQLAILADKHDTIGIDAVAMCVNDILCAGAKPLFFLDYIACGKNDPDRIATIVSGIAEGCRQSGAALIGGETAEHPGVMPEQDYDLAGFCVGIVDYNKILDGRDIVPGDVLVGLPSSGFHSNGFSLIRKLFPNPDSALLAQLLEPTRIYVNEIKALRERVTVKGLAHITGGGWVENIPRMLGKGLQARMYKPAAMGELFARARQAGGLDETDMYNTFNMGVGMVACVSAAEAELAGYPVIGVVESGDREIVLW